MDLGLRTVLLPRSPSTIVPRPAARVGAGGRPGPRWPTPNDPGDPHGGANAPQDFPDLTSAKTKKGRTTVKGSLDSTPNTTFTVQIFSNLQGEDEGRTFVA